MTRMRVMRRVMKTWSTAGGGRGEGVGVDTNGRPRRPTGRREWSEGGRSDSDSMDDAAEREGEER